MVLELSQQSWGGDRDLGSATDKWFLKRLLMNVANKADTGRSQGSEGKRKP